MDTSSWYAALNKPFFAPPTYLFGLVWSFLYLGIIITFGIVFWRIYKGKYPKSLAFPFGSNLFFNFIFSPIQLGTRNFYASTFVILAVVITLLWAIFSVNKYSKNLAILQLPYLVWGSFATILQISITILNT